jgi:alanyl-tRNA synthetase
MQYERTALGFARLPRDNVDFGGGLERIAAASIDSPDVYRISLLWPIVEELQRLSGESYDEKTLAMRVVADHVRGAAFLAADGVRPGNKEQGYVMRRLLRRAMRFALDIGLTGGMTAQLVPVIAGIYRDVYPELAAAEPEIAQALAKEEAVFGRTMRKGLSHLRRLGRTQTLVSGADLFELHDTFGMPVELSVEEATANGISLSPTWRSEFDALMAAQRARSQGARTTTIA